MKFNHVYLGLGMAGLIALSGCKSFDEYQEDRVRMR